MAKLIPLSIVIASILVPMLLAGRAKPSAKLRLTLILVLVYLFIWTRLVLRVYPTYVPLD
jgi:hypothetical protein